MAGRILEIALDLCERHGPRGVTARRVSRAVGRSPMVIYRHYGSMDHLLAAVWNEIIRRARREREAASFGVTAPDKVLRRQFAAFVEFGIAHPRLFWFMINERPDVARFELDNEGVHNFDRISASFQRCIAEGIFRADLDPRRAALEALFGLIGVTCVAATGSLEQMIETDHRELIAGYIDDLLASCRA